MEFTSDKSLAHRASVAVVSSLWNQHSIIADIENLLFSYNYISDHWKFIECKVLSSLTELELPKELKLKLKNLLQPIGKQICKWVSHTRFSCQTYPQFVKPIMFVWTEKGTLDYVKTTRLIMNCCSDKMLRFHLACIFCIEDVILRLWPDVRFSLLEMINTNSSCINVTSVMYWVYYLNNDVEELMPFYEYQGEKDPSSFAFFIKLHDRCINSITYFLQQIPSEKRYELILIATHRILSSARCHDGNILLFLFSHLKENDISQIINENAHSMLDSLLDWPCIEHFMAVANSSWNNLSKSNYLNLFLDIIECVAEFDMGDVYKNVAKQFWRSAPFSFKEFIIQKCISGTFLKRSFQYQNTDDIILMILNDCSSSEKQQIIFYFESLNICDFLVRKARWDSLKLFLKICISSPVVLEEFMDLYAKYIFYDYEASLLRTAVFFKNIKKWYE